MKNNIRISIVGGSSSDALIESCRKKGYYSVAFFGRNTDRGFGMADENYFIDLSNTQEIVEIIKEKSDCLLIGTGHKYAHKIAKYLFDENFLVSINPYTAEFGKNKILAYETINKLGFRTPKFLVIESKEHLDMIGIDNICIPSVVKSENDSVRTAKANNIEQLEELLSENFSTNSKVIVEEFIEGVEYTIPVISDGNEVYTIPKALDMTDINRIAVAHLRNFENLDEKYDRKKILSSDLKEKICQICIDITKHIGFLGFVRFDLMVDLSDEVYVLEINEVAVSRIGPDHYPWQEVNINPADEMINNIVKRYEKDRV